MPELYAKGFRYLALEALDESDTNLQARRYPVHSSGSYVNDPVMGDLIRFAIRLGFTVVPYEYTGQCMSDPANPFHCQDVRERGQAENLINQILARDLQAKMIVHVGRGHNADEEGGPFAFMATHFRRLSGIDPFTINQMHSPRLNPLDESPLYRHVTKNWDLTVPSVLVSPDGAYWADQPGGSYDLTVFHPKPRYVSGRPAWLSMDGYRQSAQLTGQVLGLSMVGQTYRGNELLIQAFAQGESDVAIPVDQFVLRTGDNLPVMMLPKGRYVIRVRDARGHQVSQGELVVD